MISSHELSWASWPQKGQRRQHHKYYTCGVLLFYALWWHAWLGSVCGWKLWNIQCTVNPLTFPGQILHGDANIIFVLQQRYSLQAKFLTAKCTILMCAFRSKDSEHEKSHREHLESFSCLFIIQFLVKLCEHFSHLNFRKPVCTTSLWALKLEGVLALKVQSCSHCIDMAVISNGHLSCVFLDYISGQLHNGIHHT